MKEAVSLHTSRIPSLLGDRTHQISVALSGAPETSESAPGIRLPAALERAHVKRRREYLAGRQCALHALREAGLSASAIDIEIGVDRGPVWPAGFVGSITHSGDQASAVVGRSRDFAGLGIDSESVMSAATAREILAHTCTAHEKDLFLGADSALSGWTEAEVVTLIFSAKESIYKCLRPLVADFFDFQAAEVLAVDSAAGSFRYQLLEDLGGGFGPGWTGTGRFLRASGWIHTAVALDSGTTAVRRISS